MVSHVWSLNICFTYYLSSAISPPLFILLLLTLSVLHACWHYSCSYLKIFAYKTWNLRFDRKSGNQCCILKSLSINFMKRTIMKRTIVIIPASILFHKSIHRMNPFPFLPQGFSKNQCSYDPSWEVSPRDLKGHTGQQVKNSSGGAQLQTRNPWFRFIPVWAHINLRKAGEKKTGLARNQCVPSHACC